MATAKKSDGLKRLRAKSGKAPSYECSNCGCKRYSPCYCMKKGGIVDRPAPAPVEEPTPETPEATE